MDKELTTAEKEALNKQKGREASQAAKKLRVKRIDALLKLLQQTFPHAFAVPYKPLKYAIAKDIIDDWKTKEDDLGELSKKCLRETLHFYTSRIDYHKACLAPEAMRVDLKGNNVSPVTDEEKIYHQPRLDTLTALQKKWADQKAHKLMSAKKKAMSSPKPPVNPVFPQDAEGSPVLSTQYPHKNDKKEV